MAEIIPFRGLRYNRQKIKDFSKVIAPPYDVISPEMQRELYQNSEYNVVRLIHNMFEGQKRYKEAAIAFSNWQDKKILLQDADPAIYVYEQDFKFQREVLTRRGFIAGLRLKDFSEGLIYPHERTMSKPREDRLKLLRSTNANLSPIFTLYIDEGNKISDILKEVIKKEPEIKTKDLTGVIQKLWLLQDEEKISIIQKAMSDKELFIADGHHRYETSLMYSQEKSSGNGVCPRDYTMAMFIDMHDKGVVIKPTHRIVEIGKVSFIELEKDLEDDFIFADCKDLNEVLSKLKENRDKIVFGLSNGFEFKFLTYKGEREFDLIVLQRELNRYLGIKYSTVQDRIKFCDDAEEALKMAAQNDHKVVFFVNPTPINTIKEMARSHQIMPQKSTYFYPKLADGLVVRGLV